MRAKFTEHGGLDWGSPDTERIARLIATNPAVDRLPSLADTVL